jgi:hypothetical protein
LSLAALACTIDVGGPLPPDIPPSLPEGSGEGVGQMWEAAVAGAMESGQVILLFDESQVTALLQDRLADGKDSAFESPIVLLREGMIQIYGVSHQGPFRANVYLSITPVLTPDGELGFELTSAEFGPLPVPESLREGMSAILTEVLSGPVGSLATGVRITTVAVEAGQLALVGELR